jgi:hypothetical protein
MFVRGVAAADPPGDLDVGLLGGDREATVLGYETHASLLTSRTRSELPAEASTEALRFD